MKLHENFTETNGVKIAVIVLDNIRYKLIM